MAAENVDNETLMSKRWAYLSLSGTLAGLGPLAKKFRVCITAV